MVTSPWMVTMELSEGDHAKTGLFALRYLYYFFPKIFAQKFWLAKMWRKCLTNELTKLTVPLDDYR
jgi:hypothetical protein